MSKMNPVVHFEMPDSRRQKHRLKYKRSVHDKNKGENCEISDSDSDYYAGNGSCRC